jgi:hypothetical protein
VSGLVGIVNPQRTPEPNQPHLSGEQRDEKRLQAARLLQLQHFHRCDRRVQVDGPEEGVRGCECEPLRCRCGCSCTRCGCRCTM